MKGMSYLYELEEYLLSLHQQTSAKYHVFNKNLGLRYTMNLICHGRTVAECFHNGVKERKHIA